MQQPWNNWFHCMGSTYGTWLPGDPRGWRTRHHREHIEGDYKNPPPGLHAARHEASKRLMKRPPVVLDLSQRLIVCRAFAQALLFHKVELIDLAVSGEHYHLLARFTPVGDKVSVQSLKSAARKLIGIAKKSSARILDIDGVWGVRGCEKPIADRTHQLSVVRYIRGHAQEGAVVWSTIREAQGL